METGVHGEEHGYTVRVDGDPDRGERFFFFLMRKELKATVTKDYTSSRRAGMAVMWLLNAKRSS